MPAQLYYITDRRQFAGDATEQERRLLRKIGECAAAGVEYVQLREKDLSARELEELASKAVRAVRGSQTKLLINSRTDIALACGAHGVHLPGNDLPASEVRAVFSLLNQSLVTQSLLNHALLNQTRAAAPVIAVSAHSLADVLSAEAHGADIAVFAPVFAKAGAENAAGLEELRRICGRAQAAIPVFALGGVTMENARLCIEAGASGIAGIRLFQENDPGRIVKALKS
jgi:thiamine-phosphate pyrophosphorylase